MNDGAPSHVHQLKLGLKQGEGVAIVAHSMTSANEALSWQRKLEKHVRLLPWKDEAIPPEKALSYYQFGDQVAVLRRWATGGSLGRNDAHAIIGPSDVLTVPVALGLDSGLDWRHAAVKPQYCLDGRELVRSAEASLAGLREHAVREPVMLRCALAMLIDAQATPLTILGCPDEHRVALTWALVHIGKECLAPESHGQNWTFSTYETDDADGIPNLPRILFMPGKPGAGTVARRKIIDVRRDDPASPEAARRSELLVQRFISGEPLVLEHDRLAAGSPARSVPDHGHNQAPNRVNLREAHHGTAKTAPAARETGSRFKKAFDDHLRAENTGLIASRLAKFGQNPDERVAIREFLSVVGYLEIVSAIANWRPSHEEQLVLFQCLRRATFGSDDSGDLSDSAVAAFAVQLVANPETPDLFVHDLVGAIDRNGQSERADPVLANRWRAQRNPAPEIGKTGRVPATPTWLLAAAGIALLAFILIVATYSIGSGTPEAGPSAKGSKTSQTTPPPPPTAGPGNESAKPAIMVSGSVKSGDLVIRLPWRQATDDKMATFLLLRAAGEDEAYPQEKCTVDKQTSTWICGKFPLIGVPEATPSFDVLILKVDPKDEQPYQMAIDGKASLQRPPDDKAVIFKVSGLP